MNGKLKNWLCGVALAGAGAMSLAAWAMEPQDGMGGDPNRMFAQMSERLDLSSEQKAKVETLMTTARETSAADRKRMQELRAQMMAMKGEFDAARARKLADEIGQLTGRMVYQATDTFAQVYKVLDDKQRTQLDGMMAKRGEHRGKWRQAPATPPE